MWSWIDKKRKRGNSSLKKYIGLLCILSLVIKAFVCYFLFFHQITALQKL